MVFSYFLYHNGWFVSNNLFIFPTSKCLGALDEMHIQVNVPKVDWPRYITRKSEIATNVLGVCSQGMQFRYVLSGLEDSAHDGQVFRDAITKPNNLKVPNGK